MNLESTCPCCKKVVQVLHMPFGDTIRCPHCGAECETDWDYSGDYDPNWWFTGEFYKPEGNQDTYPHVSQ